IDLRSEGVQRDLDEHLGVGAIGMGLEQEAGGAVLDILGREAVGDGLEQWQFEGLDAHAVHVGGQGEIAVAGVDEEILAVGLDLDFAKRAVVVGDAGVIRDLVVGGDLFVDVAQGDAQVVAVADEEAAGILGQLAQDEIGVVAAGGFGGIGGQDLVLADAAVLGRHVALDAGVGGVELAGGAVILVPGLHAHGFEGVEGDIATVGGALQVAEHLVELG